MGIVGCAFVCGVGWIQVPQLDIHPVNSMDKTALILHCTLFTVLGVMCILGFGAAVAKHRNWASIFSIALVFHLVLSIPLGIFVLVAIFTPNSPEDIKRCLNGATGALTLTVCTNGIAIARGVAVVLYVFTWILQAYSYVIVANYVRQLDEEEDAANLAPPISRPMPLNVYNNFATMKEGLTENYLFPSPLFLQRELNRPRPVPGVV
ncbi:hypothetical protein AX16_007067 [Volvariella volvacea WC 439]|nr:hypothetical protein AX16_007067 [Volvariella volvacea WC 439]